MRIGWSIASAGIGLLAGCGSSGSEGSPAQVAPALRGHVAFVVSVEPGVAGSVVFMAPLDGSSRAHMVTTSGSAFHPRFSRDGTSLYYESPVLGGSAIRKVAVDGTNDHVVYSCGVTSCECLGEDQTDRVFVWTGSLSGDGTLGTIGSAEAGAPTLVPWSASPACTGEGNLDTAGDTIAMVAGCQTDQVFVGGVMAAGPLTGRAFSSIELSDLAHIQYAAGRVFVRGMLPGSDASTAALHVMSMAADGSDVRDLDVGDDAVDFVVSNDAGFVLVSHRTSGTTVGEATYAIAAHAGATKTPIPGLGAIQSLEAVTLAWTPR